MWNIFGRPKNKQLSKAEQLIDQCIERITQRLKKRKQLLDPVEPNSDYELAVSNVALQQFMNDVGV